MVNNKDTSVKTRPLATAPWDPYSLPDFDTEFITAGDLEEFNKALTAPEAAPVVAINDWKPIYQRIRRKRRNPKRSRDETREGFVYTLLKWPFLIIVFGWITALGISYLLTRLYIYLYEHFVTWTGKREKLRRNLQSATTYPEWVEAAKKLDSYLGIEQWKEMDEYAYYDHVTIRKVKEQLKTLREKVEDEEKNGRQRIGGTRAIDDLRALLEVSIKYNFAGFENSRLYSETYYGTKNLVQEFIEETQSCLKLLYESREITVEDKARNFRHFDTNFGRTALCLSGGATFSYYHFGVIKALLDADLLPEVITGTSGGALVAALVGTRTDSELKSLLVPALAYRIRACQDPFSVWFRRWWRTGARFDSIDWARQCSWFCHGITTFREAYERTGRILNISCIPSDPHSPTILANYLTSPDCVVWSAVLASAAVPGILNPIVLMKKTRDGTLAPYSFGHKWKDGSLRTDIPLRALNLHFNVNFSIVSQVNPHINLFFFSSRGTVGRPVTHRKGRGWRGGFLGSATEQYLKLDLNKWLKVLKHLELLPKPLGQDWSDIWLQRFSGTVTIWPKSILSDFYNILSDPSPQRLARMLHVGQQSAFPKIHFISNRMKIERLIAQGLVTSTSSAIPSKKAMPTPHLQQAESEMMGHDSASTDEEATPRIPRVENTNGWSTPASKPQTSRRGSAMEEVKRQSRVFFDDSDLEGDSNTSMSEEEGSVIEDGGTQAG
jgi:predicted acylesterase/phospholipase RssA